MNISFDYERLLPLISSLYALTGIRADLYDNEFRSVCINEDQVVPFCARINAIPEGHARCVRCDREAIGRARTDRHHVYRCHAGLCESILSIRQGNTPMAYLFAGQYLDDSDAEEQWQRTKQTLDWYPGDPEELHGDFLKLRRYSTREIEAYTQILTALGTYIQLEGIIQSAEQTDAQRLDRYLEEHYREKLSLERISTELGIGRTRLCALARELSGGSTLSKMITSHRIEEARRLLRQGDEPISAVAEAVGISDYNYFTKVFRQATGQTPTDYRRASRRREPRKSEGDE